MEFIRCASCRSIHEAAGAYVEARPAFGARIGPDIARERIESVMLGLQILSQPVPDDLALLLPRVHPAAHDV